MVTDFGLVSAARQTPGRQPASGGEFVMKNGRFENHLIIS
jgi:hypothetical protein